MFKKMCCFVVLYIYIYILPCLIPLVLSVCHASGILSVSCLSSWRTRFFGFSFLHRHTTHTPQLHKGRCKLHLRCGELVRQRGRGCQRASVWPIQPGGFCKGFGHARGSQPLWGASFRTNKAAGEAPATLHAKLVLRSGKTSSRSLIRPFASTASRDESESPGFGVSTRMPFLASARCCVL